MAVAATGAIFLDRDGVINENRPDHVKSWDEFEFLPEVLPSIRRLAEIGMPIFVVTNQAVIARQQVTQATLDDIHTHMSEKVTQAGGRIDKIYYCPHDNQDKCDCRKPRPGMLKQAAMEFGVDLTRSFIVGDAWSDMEAGMSVGAHSILVMTGRGRSQGNLARCLIDYPVHFGVACDLADATMMILSALNGKPMRTTPRLRSTFHMALSPYEIKVL